MAPSSPKCSRCGRPAAITLRYMNSDLCQSHFTSMFEARVKRAVREHRMLRKGDRVAVGLSGGKDSAVLLHMLHRISKSLPIELSAITIDEGIAGYRGRTLGAAKEESEKLGVPLTVVRFEKEFGKTLDALLREGGEARSCSFCGVMRRYSLNKHARELGADKLAIGHNADDVAQTVLMNLMRNEQPERMGRFGPLSGAADDSLFVKRIKPLFTTPERDVAAYAVMRGVGVEFAECPYARFAFRQYVRQMLNSAEDRYPGTKLRIVKSFLAQRGLMHDGARARMGMPPREMHPAAGGSRSVPIAGQGEAGKIGRCGVCGEPSAGGACRLCALLGRD